MKKNFVVGILLSICLISFGSCEGKNKNDLNKMLECHGLVDYKSYPNSIFNTFEFKNNSVKEITGFQFTYTPIDEFGNSGTPVNYSVKSGTTIYDATYEHVYGVEDNTPDEYRSFSVEPGETFLVEFIFFDNGEKSISARSEKWIKNKNYKGNWKEKFKYRINAILLSDGTLLKVE